MKIILVEGKPFDWGRPVKKKKPEMDLETAKKKVIEFGTALKADKVEDLDSATYLFAPNWGAAYIGIKKDEDEKFEIRLLEDSIYSISPDVSPDKGE